MKISPDAVVVRGYDGAGSVQSASGIASSSSEGGGGDDSVPMEIVSFVIAYFACEL